MKSKTWLVMCLVVLFPLALTANSNTEATTDDGTVKFTGVFDRILIEEDGQAEWGAKFNEITGTEMEIIQPDHNQYSKVVSTMFAAGDYPDILEIQTNDYLAFAKSGNLIPLEDYIAASTELSDVDKAYLESYRLKDGHIYGVPTYNGGGCVTYLRADWLEKLGMDAPKNWDEFHAMLRAFTFDDPDGNGQDDTVGLTLPFQTGYEFDYYNRMLFQDAMFGWQLKDGKWVDGFQQPEMVEALKRVQDLYAEGVIDAEFFTNKTSTARSKVFSGQAGVMEYWSGIWATRFDQRTVAQVPGAKVRAVAPIEEAFYINRLGPVFSITTSAKNPQVIFDKFINTMLDKGEGQKLFTYGVEGVHHEVVGGVAKPLPRLSNPDSMFTKAYSDPSLIMNSWDPMIPLADLEQLSIDIREANMKQLQMPEGGDVFAKRNGEILSLKQQIFAEVVVGAYTVEEALSVYKTKAANLDIDAVIAELNN